MKRTSSAFIVALFVVLAGLASAPFLFDRLDSSLDPAPSSEAEQTEAALVAATRTDGDLAALFITPVADLDAVVAAVEALDGLGGVVAIPNETGTVLLAGSVDAALDDDGRELLLVDFTALVDEAADEVLVGGSLALDEELGSTAESDLLLADAITIPLVLLLFGLILGGLRVALMPLAIVLVVLTGSLAALLALSLVTTVSVFAINVVTLFGVGLAVDYGLLIITRYREERAVTGDAASAVVTARHTAGRAVTYSGLTVATSLSALLVFREPVLRSLAYGGIAATVLAVLAARFLLPALLTRWGHHISAIDPPDPDQGRLHRLTRRIQQRPALVAVLAVGVLVVMASPLAGIRFEGLDARALPDGSPTLEFVDALATTHPGVPTAPISVLVEGPDASSLVDQIDQIPGVGGVRVTPLGEQTLLSVVPPGAATDQAALDLVDAIRGLDVDASVSFGVTGEAAEEVDLLDSIGERLPFAVVLLVGLTLMLLIGFTRAPVVAVKAVVINALSIGAAFGLLVAIFQDGALSGLLGFTSIGALSAVILVLTFSFAFGLSMDYEVFLLARIREHHDLSGDNDLATARGLQQSGRVVTQAAALIIVVFVGFAVGDLLIVKQLGVGLALAVAVDATLVRLILVPALMTLLGEANWWTPTFLGSRSADQPRVVEATSAR